MEAHFKIFEITGGLSKENMEYSPISNELLIRNKGVVSLWSLSNEKKKILRTYRNISQSKLFRSGKYFILAYALLNEIEIELYDSSKMELVKQKKIRINASNKLDQFVIKKLFISFILKDTTLLIVKGINKQNWLIQLRFDTLTYDIVEEFIKQFKGKVKNCVGIALKDSIAYITTNNKKIYYGIYNTTNKEISVVNKLNPKLKLDPMSLQICAISKTLAILSSKGDCLIYDMSARCKGKLTNELNRFTSLSLDDGIIILGSIEGKVYVYDQSRLDIKYIIDTNPKQIDNNSLCYVILNELKDILILFKSTGEFGYYVLSALLKNKQSKCTPLITTHYHNQQIIALEWLNEQSLTFYTSGLDNQLIKWFYRGDKWISESHRLSKNNCITCIKVHPQFNNFLFASDNNGNIIQKDLCSKEDSTKTFRVANFPIEYLSFNKGDFVAAGFITGMIMLYTLDFNSKCDFSLLLNEDFLIEEIALKKKKNNHMTSFITFLSEDNMIIFRNGINKIALAGINRINNIMIPSIEDEIEYDLNDDILDILAHPSEKYIFVLLESKQINIREIFSWKNVGVIDLRTKIENVVRMNIDYTGIFLTILSSNIKGTMKNSNVMIYEIATGDIISETGELFPLSRHLISKDGRFIIVAGDDGTLGIIKLNKAIREKIYSGYDLILTRENYWKSFTIDYPIQKRVLKKEQKKIENNKRDETKFKSNQNEKEEEDKEKNRKDSNYFEDNSNNNKNSFKVDSSNKISQNNKQNDFLKQSILSNTLTLKPINTLRDNNTSFKSNYFNIQTSQKCNTMDSFNDHKLVQNISWDKTKQKNQFGYSNKNLIFLNKDPNIFPNTHSSLIKKVNQSYMKSNILSYPHFNKDLIETSSKNQQEAIRYSNITNAIQALLTQKDEEKTKGLMTDLSQTSIVSQTTQNKMKVRMNEDYYINNTNKVHPKHHLPEPEGIDDLSIINTKDNNTKAVSIISNKNDFSFISTLAQNGKQSITDDIDYINDNIEKFEHQCDDDL